jgi:diacylglycerol kinase (ATP)
VHSFDTVPSSPLAVPALHREAMRGTKNASFRRRLGFALAGLRRTARREKSFRAQLRLALLGGGLTILLRPGLVWAALFVVSAASVLALEMANAALEEALDRLHPAPHPAIGAAKDAAAGAVLVASIAALAVGGLMVLAALG